MSVRLSVVDFSSLGIERCDEDLTTSDFRAIGDKLFDTFSSIGFVYLTNHGVSADLLEVGEEESAKFLDLPTAIKEKYVHQHDVNTGWIRNDTESINPERPGDLKESYNVTLAKAEFWPDEEVPGLRKVTVRLIAMLQRLAARILQAMAVGLKLKDPNFFADRHTTHELSTLRYCRYPALTEGIVLKPGQIRCGEHSDYGSITLLFQDNVGGLQVLSKTGEWLDAVPVEGAVLVNIGDFMQMWTSDVLVSTVHRVIIPEAESKRRRPRRSLAYFVFPNKDVKGTCIDGSDKYEPMTAEAYLAMKIAEVFKKVT